MDAFVNTGPSGDNTFLTPTAPVATPSAPPVNTKVPVKTTPTEKIPPTISLATVIEKPFKTAPSISGIAADNEALAGIQYSTDGGQNWLPVDKATGLGGKTADFSFTPQGLEDGDYPLLARAIDTSSNIGTTTPVTLVIDRLEPLVGGNVLSLGPQVLVPDQNGVMTSMVGIDQKITLSAVGGPTSIVLSAIPDEEAQGVTQTFNLTKSSDTGLWSGIVSFARSGSYKLVAKAVDGAGNKTSRALNSVRVAEQARTINQKTGAAVPSRVTVYYFEPVARTWVVWDGESYGQPNPRQTDKNGNFKLFLPKGKYYLKATAGGYETLLSGIFETDESKPLTTVLTLKPLRILKFGPFKLSLPLFAVQNITLEESDAAKTANQSGLVGKPAPTFSLADTNGATTHDADLLGRPTVISFGTTWSPATAEQIGALGDLQTDKDINVVPVALQEGASKLRAYTAINGVKLTWLVDPDSTLSGSYGVQTLPMHYFLDRKGTVKQVVTGVLTKQQILDYLAANN